MDLDMKNKDVFSTPPLLNPIFLTSKNATCITCTLLKNIYFMKFCKFFQIREN